MRRLLSVSIVAMATLSGALVLSPPPASAASPAGGQERDARAVATVVTSGPNVAVNSVFSGTVAPGASQTWLWTNLPPNVVFKVGLSPVGATTTTPCRFEVTDEWYEQLVTGERRFHWTTKNTGTLACGANILL